MIMSDYTPQVYLSEEDIKLRVKELATAITRDYEGEEILVICILKGAVVFCSDLIREIDLPVQLEFMSVSSYGESFKSSGEVKVDLDLTESIKGKHVLVVEDIVDSGLTMSTLKNLILSRGPESFKLASLLIKPTRVKRHVEIDYLGFEVEDKFVIGYGLDYAGRYRELPYIGVLNAGN
jgi:hypoxanthine phosphoribosyltransferase